jgi:hypothetical protein
MRVKGELPERSRKRLIRCIMVCGDGALADEEPQEPRLCRDGLPVETQSSMSISSDESPADEEPSLMSISSARNDAKWTSIVRQSRGVERATALQREQTCASTQGAFSVLGQYEAHLPLGRQNINISARFSGGRRSMPSSEDAEAA